MTSGPSGTYVAELTQSRNATASEALAIIHAHMKTFKSRMPGVGRFNRAALLVAAGVAGAVLMTTMELPWVRSLPTIYPISVIVFVAAVGVRIWMRSHYKRYAEAYRQSFKASRRFVMDEHALVAVNAAGVSTSIPWSAIEDIVDDRHTITIYLSPAEQLSLPKAACENQNADRFCRELRRRWQDRRLQRATA